MTEVSSEYTSMLRAVIVPAGFLVAAMVAYGALRTRQLDVTLSRRGQGRYRRLGAYLADNSTDGSDNSSAATPISIRPSSRSGTGSTCS